MTEITQKADSRVENIYRHQFVSVCPANHQPIVYSLEISTDQMIRAEQIVTAAALCKSGFHEAIADDLFARFGGKQVLKAHHHGVDIETRRGFEEVNHGRLTQRVQVGSTVFEKGVEAIHAIKAVSRHH
jgi:GH25 family lysozyme M1 (1,4-beta-N-acetylmuramidase)